MPARSVGRIQSRAAFARLQRSRARATSGPVRATFVPVDEAVPGLFPQVGYAIGRHCGNAVVRNTLRRRMREAARASALDLPRGTYLLRVDPAAARCERAQFSAHVVEALRRAGRYPGLRP
ncbi:MAG TPA: ribonuclease P protein component [Acidimicrobiales bacterium]|nr:ribonuclease P protein component [Acidimicrobiales bacterium]